ncbi:hypothetical protein M758_7G095800 [Ceratodon purpureus]|nr:hypothetical protein M758_7G095800 [Ceratodon purpureus]
MEFLSVDVQIVVTMLVTEPTFIGPIGRVLPSIVKVMIAVMVKFTIMNIDLVIIIFRVIS